MVRCTDLITLAKAIISLQEAMRPSSQHITIDITDYGVRCSLHIWEDHYRGTLHEYLNDSPDLVEVTYDGARTIEAKWSMEDYGQHGEFVPVTVFYHSHGSPIAAKEVSVSYELCKRKKPSPSKESTAASEDIPF